MPYESKDGTRKATVSVKNIAYGDVHARKFRKAWRVVFQYSGAFEFSPKAESIYTSEASAKSAARAFITPTI